MGNVALVHGIVGSLDFLVLYLFVLNDVNGRRLMRPRLVEVKSNFPEVVLRLENKVYGLVEYGYGIVAPSTFAEYLHAVGVTNPGNDDDAAYPADDDGLLHSKHRFSRDSRRRFLN